MRIFIKKLDDKITAYQVQRITSIRALKQQINKEEGIPMESMRLIYGGKPLYDDTTIADNGIVADAALFLILRLPGGDQIHLV